MRTHPGHPDLVRRGACEERHVRLGLGVSRLVLFAAHRGGLASVREDEGAELLALAHAARSGWLRPQRRLCVRVLPARWTEHATPALFEHLPVPLRESCCFPPSSRSLRSAQRAAALALAQPSKMRRREDADVNIKGRNDRKVDEKLGEEERGEGQGAARVARRGMWRDRAGTGRGARNERVE